MRQCNALTTTRQQRGQVMPMTLVFIAAVILSLWVMYDAGSAMSDKIRLQNTADSVAYSTATLVSRDLNFIAYTNRGMVANQVAIAQMVGLSSWAASIEQLAVNLNELGQYIPWVTVVTGSMEQGATAVSTFVDQVAERVIPLNDEVIHLLSEAQDVFHTSLTAQIATFSDDIAQRNDPDAYALLSVGGVSFAQASDLIGEWNQQIGSQYELQAQANRSSEARLENGRYLDFEQVVSSSRDRFSSARSYEWDAPFSGNLYFVRWKTRKYGGSDFVRSIDSRDDTYRWDWAAMNTASIYVRYCEPISGCSRESEGFVAWGAAHSLDASNSGSFFDYGVSAERRNRSRWGQGAWRNPASAGRTFPAGVLNSPYWSATVGGEDHIHHALPEIRGLREFYEFRSDEPIDSGPAVVALYVKDEEHVASQQDLMTRDGGTVAPDIDSRGAGGFAAQRMGAVAKAQPYYARPTDMDNWRRRADNRIEYGNLYNPYWQPRLIDLTDEEKAAATAIVGGGIAVGGGS